MTKSNNEKVVTVKNGAPNDSIAGKNNAKSSADTSKGFWSKTWVYILLLGILTFAVFYQFFFSNQMLFSSDQIGGFDSKVFFKDAMTKFHQFPLWFNSRLGGMPTADATFGDAFYPFSIIATYFLPIARAISIKMIFHIFLAGVFFFLMLRKGFKFSPLVSFCGAVFYMLNPEFLSHIYSGHDGKMYVIAWLPFVVWRLKSLMEMPSIFNITLLSVGVGISLLSSHVQLVYFVLWGMFFYWIIACVQAFREKNVKKIIGMSISFWIAIFIGIGIAIIQFLPSYLYVQNAYSVRGVDRGFEFASSWSLHWPEFFSMWVPEFVNTLDYYWGQNPFKLNAEYAGAMAMLLSVLAIIIKPSMWRIFWGAVAAFSLLFAMGAHTPVFYIAYYLIPGVKKFRACSMMMFWFSFATVLLSSLSLKDIVREKLSSLSDGLKKKWVKGILIAIASCAVLAILFSMQGFVSGLFSSVLTQTGKQNVFDINFTKNFVPYLWVWFFFVAIVLGSLFYVINGKLKPQYFVVIVFIIGLVDLLRVDSQFIKLFDPMPYFATEAALQPLQQEMNTAPFRCFSLPGTLPQNGEGIHGLEGVSGFHDNELRWYRDFRGEQDRNYIAGIVDVDPKGQPYLSIDRLKQGSPLLDIANVKYLLVRSQNDLLSIENNNALGRVSFAPNYIILDSTRVVESMMKGAYDYRTTIALDKEPSVKPVNKNIDSLQAFSSKWEKYSPNYRKVDVNVPGDGFIRISEVYYPGWVVKVDSKKVDIYKADLAWMAVPITKGNHTLEMEPHCIGFSKFALISFSIVGMILIYWLFVGVLAVSRKKTA